jgi:hypothetical protein
MSRSTNAVLLSALVLPGAGQIYLKHYRRGIVLVAISLVCLWVIVEKTLQQAASVIERLTTEGGVPDAGQIADLVTQTSNGSVTLAGVVLAACWLVGIVDAYRLGRKQDERPLFR